MEIAEKVEKLFSTGHENLMNNEKGKYKIQDQSMHFLCFRWYNNSFWLFFLAIYQIFVDGQPL